MTDRLYNKFLPVSRHIALYFRSDIQLNRAQRLRPRETLMKSVLGMAALVIGLSIVVQSGAGSSVGIPLAASVQAPAAQGRGGGGGRGRGPSAGALLWEDQCAGCHGNDSAGGRAPSLFDQKWLDRTSDARMASSIKNGVPDTEMEPFGKALTDEQIFQVIQHIRAQGGAPARPRADFVEAPDGVVITSEKQKFKVELVADGLMTPWALAFLPDGRLLVTERDGNLRIVDKGQLSAPVTGLPKAHVQQDGGYLDVEVHPQYATNGWIYLSYVEDQPGYVAPPPPTPEEAAAAAAAAAAAGRGRGRGGPPQVPSMTVVVRGRISSSNAWTDEQVIFRAPTDLYTTSGAHYGSRFAFDRDNHLFFTLGERNANNPNRAQDLSSPLGKIHRFNDDGSVPADNPFVGTPGAIGSIWTYGHRNPEGLAWDPVSGKLWESEHGPNTADEINLLEKGHNYGWNLVSKQGPPQYQISAPGMDDPKVYFTPTLCAGRHLVLHGRPLSGLEEHQSLRRWPGRSGPAASRGRRRRRRRSGGGLRPVRPRARHHPGSGRAVLHRRAESHRRAEPRWREHLVVGLHARPNHSSGSRSVTLE